MIKKIKIIDLLCLISNGKDLPRQIKYKNHEYDLVNKQYLEDDLSGLDLVYLDELNDEVEILDDEEDKDIPLIPDDKLIVLNQDKKVDISNAIDYNFKVLKDQINILTREFNEYRKENE